MKNLTSINRLVFLILFLSGICSNIEAQCPIYSSLTKKTCCRRTNVKFWITDQPSTYAKILWEYGDGQSSTPMLSSVFHLYDTFGVFKVRVTTYYSNMTIKCRDSINITVYDIPNAVIKLPSIRMECYKGNNFCFINLSSPGNFTHAPVKMVFWDFGDGDSSFNQNPCHSYKTSGIYTIYLQVKDTNGCIDSNQKTTAIVVLPDLKPEFTTTFKVSCPKTAVTFNNKTDTFNKSITKFYWNFGDGSRDSSQNNWTGFKHIYTKVGYFTPKFYVKSSYGCVDSFRLPNGARNIVCHDLFTDFDTIGGVQPCAPQTVKFIDKSFPVNEWKYTLDSLGNKTDSTRIDSIVSWQWNFGDNKGNASRSALQSPIHTYTQNGDFDVKLIVTSAKGFSDTIIKHDFIHLAGPKPQIRLIGDSIGCRIFVYSVKDSSRNVKEWRFIKGDGKESVFKIRPSDSVFKLIYDTVGVFNMYLIASDSVWNQSIGMWTQCSTIYGDTNNPDEPHFNVTVLRLTHSAFTPLDTTIHSGSMVEFTPKSDTEYKYAYWEFGESNPFDTTSAVLLPANQKARHTYVLPAGKHDSIYHVYMTAQGAMCPDGSKFGRVRVIDSTVGVSDIIMERNFRVYPNPVTDQLTVTGKTFGSLIIYIKIYNTSGKLFFNRTCVNKTLINETIDLKYFPAGIYYLDIKYANKKDTFKLIKD